MTRSIAPSADLGTVGIVAALAFGLLSVALLFYELYRSRARGKAVAVTTTGIAAIVALVSAALRPVTVEQSGIEIGPRVIVLADASRSMLLPDAEGRDRRSRRDESVAKLKELGGESRLDLFTFGEGNAFPTNLEDLQSDAEGQPRSSRSDLVAALESVTSTSDEPPSSIVVLSDGVLDRPTPEHTSDVQNLGLGGLNVPIHTVALAPKAPKDASVRNVRLAGASVAHQPFAIQIDVGCGGGLDCEKLPVAVRELSDAGPAEVLAQGEVDLSGAGDESRSIELSVTLHRAGPRVVEVVVKSPSGDTVPENDHRFLTLDVARDRVRVLHIAGRPTYDVRAMRTWLKGDQSVDVVAFFILRTPTDSVGASSNDLALIPFPVDELFTTHLPSFDAVVLQDFNAATYGLTRHLENLAEYVRGGGGLIMVGGPDAFGPGKYTDTALAAALPVKLDPTLEDKGVDLGLFTPQLTPAGRVAPVLAALRDVIGDTLPDMPGTNVVGAANPGATVLLTHPTLGGEERMPVLALGEYGTGRTIALTVDGTHQLMFSAFAADRAGRGYGALWDGLLGWLMRDPRFESTSLALPKGCVAGEPSSLVITPLPGHDQTATITVTQLGSGTIVHDGPVEISVDGSPVTVDLPALDAGGYSVSVRLGSSEGQTASSLAPATRRDFACEEGGAEWADSRPDLERLRALAKTTGGVYTTASKLDAIPFPKSTMINTQRKTAPILPPWAWTMIAAGLVGVHWVVRRRGGLT